MPDHTRRSGFALFGGIALATLVALSGCRDRDPTRVDPVLHTLVVELTGHGSGAVTSDPAGIDCTPAVATCTAEFPRGTRVTLTAAPDAGEDFQGWADGCTGQAVCVVEMTGDRTVAARFDNPRLAVREVGPGGGTVASRDGNLTLSIPPGALSAAEEITVRRIDASELGPEFDEIVAMGPVRAYDLGPDGLAFAQPVTVKLLTDQRITVDSAGFEMHGEFLLTSEEGRLVLLDDVRVVFDEPIGAGYVVGQTRHFSPIVGTALDGAARFRVDGLPARLEVGAVAAVEFSLGLGEAIREMARELSGLPDAPAGGSLAEWGDYSEPPLHTPQRFNVLPRLGDAHFRVVDYTCTAVGNGMLSGLIYVGWENNPLIFGLSIQEVPVDCVAPPQSLTVAIAGTGDGRVTTQPAGIDCTKAGGDCDETFPAGTAVKLTAAAAAGSAFEGWSGDGIGGHDSTTVVMDSTRHVVAHFARVQERFMSAGLVTAGIRDAERIVFVKRFSRWVGGSNVRQSISVEETDDCPPLLVTGTGGAAVVRSCRDELLKAYTARFTDRVYYDGFFLPVPDGATGSASLLLSGQGYALCALEDDGDLPDLCLFDFNRSTYPDAAAIGGDAANGAVLVNGSRGQLDFVRWNASGGGYRIEHDVGDLFDHEDLRPFQSVATNVRGDRLLVVVQDNLVSELYFVDLTTTPSRVQRVMQLRAAARRLRCDPESGLCALSHFGGSASARLVTLFRWDGETAPRSTPVSLVRVSDGLADGPVGIEVLGNRVVTAGFHDGRYSIVSVDLSGSPTGGGELPFTLTTQALPEGCTRPGHAAFARDRHRSIVASCHGSTGWAYVPGAY